MPVPLSKVPRAKLEKIWEQVNRSAGPEECWPWMGSPDWAGYGRLRLTLDGRSRFVKAHRVVYMLAHPSSTADSSRVKQRCLNRLCCNPIHLYCAGSAAQMTESQLQHIRERVPRGSRSHLAKLDDVKIQEILEAHGKVSATLLARKYEVTRGTIYRIWARKSWAHLSPRPEEEVETPPALVAEG